MVSVLLDSSALIVWFCLMDLFWICKIVISYYQSLRKFRNGAWMAALVVGNVVFIWNKCFSGNADSENDLVMKELSCKTLVTKELKKEIIAFQKDLIVG